MRVCKFGGAATRDAAGFERIREIVAADRARQVIVPSAPEIRRYCLTASAGIGQQSKDCMPSVSLRSTLFAVLAAYGSHFRSS